ncbi:MAG: flavin reductase family protein [Clostridia bacterium]|nr:flavin reductase family protein [Clostridia bacterium]
MKKLALTQAIAPATEALMKGYALLNVGGETPNTMTIGWGFIGYSWNKPVFCVVVRKQRHTHDLLMKEGQFTVSMTLDDGMKEQFKYAGTKSGRDEDKFDGHGLTAVSAQCVNAPIVKECTLHFECKTKLVQEMTEDRMDAEISARIYPEKDFHTMVFGEIVDIYTTEE